jgi:hypothetical protein
MTPLSGPWTRQQGNSLDSSGDRIGNKNGDDDNESGFGKGGATTRTRGETQRISTVFGVAASADATTTAADAISTIY